MFNPTKSGDTVKILQLLSLGYSPIQKFPEAENGTPLHIAALEGHILTAHVLVQAGAELDALDDEQTTPLMLACIKGNFHSGLNCISTNCSFIYLCLL